MKWEESTLYDLGTLNRGKSKHRPRDAEHLYGGAYPFIQTGDVKQAPFYIKDYSQTYSDAGLAQSKLWPRGTLCITIAANIAETAILDIDACFPDSIIGFTSDPKKSDVRFVKYLIDHQKKRLCQISQGTTQDNLSGEKLLKLKFPVPPLPVQKKIADILSAYDDLIEVNRRSIQLLEESARRLYKEWFVHFRFPNHEKVKMVDGLPEGWKRGVLSDMFDSTSGGTPSRSHEEYYTGSIPWVKTQELDDRYIIDTEEKITQEAVANSSAKIYPKGTLLISIYGGTNIGRTGILAMEGASNQACVALFPKDNGDSVYYCHQWAMSMREHFIGLSQGAAQTNISQQTLRSQSITMPDADVIKRFASQMRIIYERVRLLLAENDLNEEARDRILPRLMSGKFDLGA